MATELSKELIITRAQQLYDEKGKPITFTELEKSLGVSQKRFRAFCVANDVYEDYPDVNLHIQRPLHNFDELDEETAYWVGYLMADGCLALNSGKSGKRLMLECQTADKEILIGFCDWLGIRHERITSGHNGQSVALSLSIANFTTSPEKYGITEHKSHHENHVYPEILDDNKLFYAYYNGLIDGDGCISTSTSSRNIHLIDNSEVFINEIGTKLRETLPYPSSVWLMNKSVEQQYHNATQPIYEVVVGTGGPKRLNAKFLYEYFYDGTHYYLQRKQEKLKMIAGL